MNGSELVVELILKLEEKDRRARSGTMGRAELIEVLEDILREEEKEQACGFVFDTLPCDRPKGHDGYHMKRELGELGERGTPVLPKRHADGTKKCLLEACDNPRRWLFRCAEHQLDDEGRRIKESDDA